MPLIKATLEVQIKAAFDKVSDGNIKPDKARKELAADLATAFDAYIKSGTVITAVAGTVGIGSMT